MQIVYSVDELKKNADKLSLQWKEADRRNLKELKEECGDKLYDLLRLIEKKTGEWYRPIEDINL